MNFGKRGQSALEYLMTYGWALVVIVIAVAALVVLINPSTIQGNQCDAKLGPFTISQSQVTATQTQLVLVNQTGQTADFNSVSVVGTDGDGDIGTITDSAPTLASSQGSIPANGTDTLVIDAALGTGAYSLTYTVTYNAGQLSNITAAASCRGTLQ